MDEAVFFKEIDKVIYVRAEGHVTASLCPGLKARIFARLDSEPRIEQVYFDLSACEYMDSTFLGLIVGTYKRFLALTGKRVVLLKVNEACRGLLKTIGVLSLVELSDKGLPFPGDMERIAEGTKANAQFILDAHEELSGLSLENRDRFAVLTAILKGTLKKDKNG